MGRVSQWGPNPQGVRSRSDRSVSLRDVRDLPVQRAGFASDVHTVIDRVRDTGEYRVRFYADDIYQGEENDYYADDREDAEDMAKRIEEEAAVRRREVADEEEALGEIAEAEEGGEFVEMPLVEDERERAVSSVEARGLTADEAFQQGLTVMHSSSGNPVWVYGGHGNPPQRQVGPNTWIGEGYGELAGAVGKTDPSVNPDNPDEVLDFLGKGVPVGQEEGKTAWEIQPDGTVVEVPVPDPAAWVPNPDAVPDAVPDAPPDPGSRPLLSQGLTADQAFQQHKAASGYSMMGKRPDSKQGYFPGFGGANESIEQDIAESKENVRPRTPEEQAAWEREQKVRNSPRLPVRPPPPLPPPVSQMAGPDYAEGEYATSNWWDSVPGLDDLPDSGFDEEGVADFDPWDPELRSMDSQMLADMVAARAAQPDEGYFGGMGEAVQGLTARVAEMSGTERAALISALVAAGLLTVGSGGVLAPAGAALLGGAGMAAMNP